MGLQRYARVAIIKSDLTWKPVWVKTDGANGHEMSANAIWRVRMEMGLPVLQLPKGVLGISVLEITVDPDWAEMGEK